MMSGSQDRAWKPHVESSLLLISKSNFRLCKKRTPVRFSIFLYNVSFKLSLGAALDEIMDGLGVRTGLDSGLIKILMLVIP